MDPVMRKPRVVIFNDDGYIKQEPPTFFNNNDYETFIVTESVTCPIYGKKESKSCAGPVLCCDLMVAAHDIEQSKGIDLFIRQFRIGCKLTSRNKAIITRFPVHDRLDHIAARGMTIFESPLDFGVFEAWVKDCESRMDLTQRLAVIRGANRNASSNKVQFRLSGEDVYIVAQTVNVSSYGICLKTSNPLKRGQMLHFVDQIRADAEEGIIQWAKKFEDGWYRAGVTLCV
jgi:hypothetical protein